VPARFLVHETQAQPPQTHAIVIGVGDYPHLSGGSGKLSGDNDGMGQLTSPPISANQFADWLIRSFHNPNKPLGTVALLVSEKTSKEFVNPTTGQAHMPTPATADNIVKALTEWKLRGDAHLENMLIFFFCGHGISAGTEAALLASDYGANENNSLDGAIDLRKLILGLDQCMASEQIFFIDACRASSDTLITAQSSGRLVIQPRIRNSAWPPRRSGTFYATLRGDAAYGLPDQPTVFTASLIEAFDQLAADNEEGDWRINTNRMAEALDHLIARQRSLYPGLAQVPESNDRSKVHIHYLRSPPEALVYLCCDPPSDLHVADILYVPDGGDPIIVPRPAPGATETELRLRSDFSAVLPGRTVKMPRYISPVYRRITFR
jgi:Caspase domain